MDVIYSVKAGTGREKVYDLQMCIDSLKEKGCELIIAGCTEIPILLPFV
jgi:aspartate/glutamate racemase